MTLPRQWQRHALALVEQASPLEGEFFRSVELAYAHPDDVVSGEGTRSYGGRFVRPGLRAVYGSVDEETAFRESAARVNRLAGRGGARVVIYPRITYVIAVKIAAHVALTEADADAAAILPACLDPCHAVVQRDGPALTLCQIRVRFEDDVEDRLPLPSAR